MATTPDSTSDKLAETINRENEFNATELALIQSIKETRTIPSGENIVDLLLKAIDKADAATAQCREIMTTMRSTYLSNINQFLEKIEKREKAYEEHIRTLTERNKVLEDTAKTSTSMVSTTSTPSPMVTPRYEARTTATLNSTTNAASTMGTDVNKTTPTTTAINLK